MLGKHWSKEGDGSWNSLGWFFGAVNTVLHFSKRFFFMFILKI